MRLRPGSLIRPTPTVIRFVDKHVERNRGRPTRDLIQSMANEISAFRKVGMSHRELIGWYAQRPADKIISSGAVAVIKKGDANYETTPIVGCVCHGTALVGALRVLLDRGMIDDALFARRRGRSYVKYKEGGEWYKVDMHRAGDVRVRRYTREMLKNEKNAAAKGTFAEGNEAHDIGLTGMSRFHDFAQHVPPERRFLSW